MVAERIDVRLDSESRRKLTEIVECRHISTSNAIREAISELYEAEMRKRRWAAVRRMAEANIEDVPEPEELSRQLAQTHDIGPLY